jgi:hypothetical protein
MGEHGPVNATTLISVARRLSEDKAAPHSDPGPTELARRHPTRSGLSVPGSSPTTVDRANAAEEKSLKNVSTQEMVAVGSPVPLLRFLYLCHTGFK